MNTDRYRGIFVSDLDGTLLGAEAKISATNRLAFESLGNNGILRVIATGRSLYSARRCLPPDFPVEYVILSTGNHLMNWVSKMHVQTHGFSIKETTHIAGILQSMRINFMMHGDIPENHHFYYSKFAPHLPDFSRRVTLYEPYARELAECPPSFRASQFLVVLPTDQTDRERIGAALASCSIIFATSPLDNASIWVEIFPKNVSKSSGIAWIQQHLQMENTPVGAIGNDFNDQDMLDSAQHAYRVDNATFSGNRRYRRVPTNEHDGVAFAIQDFLQRITAAQ